MAAQHRIGPTRTPVLLRGASAGAWPVPALAVREGHVRIAALEDALQPPSGDIAPDNAAPVTAASPLIAQR